MIKKNMKLIIGIILGLFVTTGVYAINTLNASSISINKTNMSKVPESNLQSALDYLYGKSKTTNAVTIESGVLHENQTYLGIVYLNPTNLDEKCTAENSVSTTNTKVGCMKWYIYKEDGSNYYAILDHNTTDKVAYNSDSVNTSQKEIATALTTDTTGWASGLNPRLITADEIAEITGANTQINWNSATATSTNYFYLDSKNDTSTNTTQGTSAYAWLYDNTMGCLSYGCNTADSSNYGYWTSTPVYENDFNVWYVSRIGLLNRNGANNTDIGLRPVITVSKNLFN